MAHYVSVRGWIEFEEEFLPRVNQLVKDFSTRDGNGIITASQASLYSKGWIVSQEAPNWTKYCFYGADIRKDALDFLKAQVHEVAKLLVSDDQDMEDSFIGIFYIDDDEDEVSLVWYIIEGGIIEKIRDRPIPYVSNSTTISRLGP